MTDDVFRLHVLPAGNGDALVIEYGNTGGTHCVLIDGGVSKTASAVADLLGADASVELLVVTHIDNDHIAGILKLLESAHPPHPEHVWFNGYRHLPESAAEAMGPVEGEKLTKLIGCRKYRWNDAFDGNAVMLREKPTTVTLDGGLACTVLSPGIKQLKELRKKSTWTRVVQEAGLDPDFQVPPLATKAPASRAEKMGQLNIEALADLPTDEDTAPANGSTIALLVEFADRRCLLAGDAHPGVLIEGINQIAGPEGVLAVDVFKLPHHGSKANVTIEMLRRVRAKTYVFSTDGSGNQRHPDDQAVARVIKYADGTPMLAFNYRSVRNKQWDDPALKALHQYRTQYPPRGQRGITVDLLASRGQRESQEG